MGLLVALSLIGAVAVSALVFQPRHAFGGAARLVAATPPPPPARREDHQRLMERFAALLGRCNALLAVHQRGRTPYLELVLWLNDDDRSGRAEPPEMAVISHSRIMQTVTLYRWRAGARTVKGALEVIGPSAAAFCNAWRADRNVEALVLVSGVSDLRAEAATSPVAGRRRLRITLTWAGNSVDAPDAASAEVEVAAAPDVRE